MDTEEISRLCDFIKKAQVTGCEILMAGSNWVFVTGLELDGREGEAVYKPREGEAPLWDFPDGTLYRREYAAFLVSQELGWDLIPPTVIRKGPYGIGSMQHMIDRFDQDVELADVSQGIEVFRKVAFFDIIVNNADRKAGHFLVDKEKRLWLVDHGLTFNAEPKLRTVLWDFAGEVVPEDILTEGEGLLNTLRKQGKFRKALSRLIDAEEIGAFESRIEGVLNDPVFPNLTSARSVPWPWY